MGVAHIGSKHGLGIHPSHMIRHQASLCLLPCPGPCAHGCKECVPESLLMPGAADHDGPGPVAQRVRARSHCGEAVVAVGQCVAVTNEMPWFHAAEDQGCQPDGGTSEEVSGGEQVVRWESISVYLMHGDGITVPTHSPEIDERAYPEMDEVSQLPSSGQWLSRARLWCTGITPRVAAHPVPNAAWVAASCGIFHHGAAVVA